MEHSEYIKMISKHYMCSLELAEKIIKSAELNSKQGEMERIAREEKELIENADNYFQKSF